MSQDGKVEFEQFVRGMTLLYGDMRLLFSGSCDSHSSSASPERAPGSPSSASADFQRSPSPALSASPASTSETPSQKQIEPPSLSSAIEARSRFKKPGLRFGSEPSIMNFDYDVVSLVLLRIIAISAFGNLSRSCRALQMLLSNDTVWRALLETNLGQFGVAQLDKLGAHIGWRELHKRVHGRERCAWKRCSQSVLCRQPTSRVGHAAAVLGDRVLLYGGESSEQKLLGDSWLSSPVGHRKALQWRSVAQNSSVTPGVRTAMSVAVVKNRVYVFGGLSDSEDLLGDTWFGSVDGDDFTWTRTASEAAFESPIAREGFNMCAHKNSLLMFGGETGDHTVLDDTWLGVIASSGEVEWRPCFASSNSPAARWHHSLTSLSASVCLFGGEGVDEACLNDLWLCMVQNQQVQWHQAITDGPSPDARASHSAAAVPSMGSDPLDRHRCERLLLFGGEQYSTASGSSNFLSDTWLAELDLTINMNNQCAVQWTKLENSSCSPHPPPRAGGARVIGNQVIVFGGDTLQGDDDDVAMEGSVLDDTWIGSVGHSTITWQNIPQNSFFCWKPSWTVWIQFEFCEWSTCVIWRDGR